MAQVKVSIKHVQIDKANRSVILASSIAVVVAVFSLFIGRAMIQRLSHRNVVIEKKETALRILKENLEARDQIVDAYELFLTNGTEPNKNIIGGSNDPAGLEPNDGDNARLVLDALPSKYDFPAMVTSIEKVLGDAYKIDEIDGEDKEVEQSEVALSVNPEIVEMPVSFTIIESNYDSITNAVKLFERSIRPFKVNSFLISGENESLSLEIKLTTYYQPEKILGITEEVVN